MEESTIVASIEESVDQVSSVFTSLWETIVDYVTSFGLNFVLALIFFIIAWKLVNVAVKYLQKTTLWGKIDPTLQSFLKSLISILLKIFIIIMALSMVGIATTSIVTVIATCGVAVGLALQDSLSNVAGGFILAFLKPFKVGDFISNGTYSGTVRSINIFYTKLVTVDNTLVMIPNKDIANATVTDYSAYETRRVDIEIGVDYNSDIRLVKEVLSAIAEESEHVLKEPKYAVVLTNYGDSSIDFELRVWCASSDYWPTKFDLMEQIKYRFDENNISIPFPQMDVHMNELSDAKDKE